MQIRGGARRGGGDGGIDSRKSENISYLKMLCILRLIKQTYFSRGNPVFDSQPDFMR